MNSIRKIGIIAGVCFAIAACGQTNRAKTKEKENKKIKTMEVNENQMLATFGGGCFWCTEAFFLELKGVNKVVSGYAGGHMDNPTYKQVCSGLTGHAEVIQIGYDPKVISYEKLLEVFMKTHDPTTLNRQGNDVGIQYRSVVFYHSAEQKAIAEKILKDLEASKAWDNPIVTEIAPISKFYPAEDYHQNYFNQNGDQPYCQYVIQPKVEKFHKVFKAYLKE